MEVVQRFDAQTEIPQAVIFDGLTVQDVNEQTDIRELDFLNAGLISSNLGGDVFLTPELVAKLAPTFMKKPVFIDHFIINSQNYKREKVGVVVGVDYKYSEKVGADVWFARVCIDTTSPKGKEAVRLLNSGWKASCEYLTLDKQNYVVNDKPCWLVTETQAAGIAIVEHPRYTLVETRKVINNNMNPNVDIADPDVTVKASFLSSIMSSLGKIVNSKAANEASEKEEEEKKAANKAANEAEEKAFNAKVRNAVDEYEKEKEANKAANKAANEAAEKDEEEKKAANKAANAKVFNSSKHSFLSQAQAQFAANKSTNSADAGDEENIIDDFLND